MTFRNGLVKVRGTFDGLQNSENHAFRLQWTDLGRSLVDPALDCLVTIDVRVLRKLVLECQQRVPCRPPILVLEEEPWH